MSSPVPFRSMPALVLWFSSSSLLAAESHVESRGWIDQRQDVETGLTYLHARHYDPALGVFVSPDTLNPVEPGVGVNRFAYSMDDPINASDRSGNARCVLNQYQTVFDDGFTRSWYWDIVSVCFWAGGGVTVDRIRNTPHLTRRAPKGIAAVAEPSTPTPVPAPPALPGPVAPICSKFPEFPACTGAIAPPPNACAQSPGLPGCGTSSAPPAPPRSVPMCAKFPFLPGCSEGAP